ncbi:unnamed protein product [Sphagnum jensenii]|uniref:Uncharacterized protein n=1 Tax=Sphagnum jensenii TaxID=128206 RepID=A0ABP1C232_9BRYO
MAAAEGRAAWQRTNRHLIQEDSVRAPKLSHCPSLSKGQAEFCHPSTGRAVENIPSFYSTNSWGSSDSKIDTQWQQLSSNPKFKSGHPPAFQAAEAMRSVTEEGMIDSIDEDKAARDDTEEVNVIRGEIMAKSVKESGEIFSSTDAKNPQTMCFGVQQDQIMEKTMEKCMSMEGKCVLKLEETVVASPGDAFAKSSTVKAGVSWRTANKEALAALVAQKGAERVQNCDLPTPQSKPVLKTPLESCDVMDETALGISGSMDHSLMAAILQAGEPTLLESLKLPASPFASTKLSPKPSTCHFPKSSQPLAIPALPNTFPPHRPLGEALCHSQTRAREAEKKADQTLQEYKKLSKLFFQEASLSLTYRQWVTSLQAENTRLKMYVKNQQAAAWLQRRFFSPFAALERLSSNHWKKFGKKQAHHQTHRHFSAIQPDKDSPPGNVPASYRQTGAGIIVGCTLGFAFALGLTLASAGLVLGWSMGWIVLAY